MGCSPRQASGEYSRIGKAYLFLTVIVLCASGCRHARHDVVWPGTTCASVTQTPSIWPVEHPEQFPITQRFGPRANPKPNQPRLHGGLDIAAPEGTRVRATADGVTTFAGKNGNYGKMVSIDHGRGIETRYGHLRDVWMKEGKRVKQGQWIGETGATGNATGPHLHYEIRVNGTPVNPEAYLPQSHR